MAADYNIRSGGHAFIKATSTDSAAKVSSQLADIKTLCGKAIGELKVLSPDTDEASLSAGCAVYVVSAEIAILLQVSTQVTDIDAEVKKITAKLQKTNTSITKQEELLNREGFEKVSDVVQATERKKLVDYQAAKENYERTLEEFNKLKMGDTKA